jgi:serine/threonine protein kinase
MSEQWKSWEGQTVEGKFPLRQFLGSAPHSAVFLTELSEPQPGKAAIKLIAANSPAADLQVALWKRAAHLQHSNLLPIFDCGRCRLDGQDLLYVVMEYAEENLAEILPQRALTAEEVRDMLNPALDVLVYLHGKGFVHGHLKPSNLLATQDCLKLSSDSILPIGEPRELHRERDIYDSPESQSSKVSPKDDVWSLGATLLESLTQTPPVLPAEPAADPASPGSIPQPFGSLVQNSLRREATKRWSVAEVALRLNPSALAAAAAASSPAIATLSPLSVPISPEPAVPISKLPAATQIPDHRVRPPVKRGNTSLADYAVPALLGAAVLVGLIFAIPKLFNFRGQPASSAKTITAGKPSLAKPVETREAQSAPVPAPTTPEKSAPSEPRAKLVKPAVETSSLAPAPAVLREDASAPPRMKVADDAVGRGEILDQVLPKVSPKALATIQGKIRVVVKAQVDASGTVTTTELDNPGPSKYFADLAEKAAHKWQFAGAEADGHGIPSEWLIRFEFSSTGVHAAAQQSVP